MFVAAVFVYISFSIMIVFIDASNSLCLEISALRKSFAMQNCLALAHGSSWSGLVLQLCEISSGFNSSSVQLIPCS